MTYNNSNIFNKHVSTEIIQCYFLYTIGRWKWEKQVVTKVCTCKLDFFKWIDKLTVNV